MAVEVREDPLPRYPLHRIKDLANKIYLRLVPYVGQPIRGELFQQLARELADELHASEDVVTDSMVELLAGRMDEHHAQVLAGRMAGNCQELQKGLAAPWRTLPPKLWAPVRVVRVEPDQGNSQPAAILHTRVIAGPACMQTATGKLTLRVLRLISRRIGFTTARGKRPFSRMAEYTGLCFFALLRVKDGRLWFYRVRCTDSLRKKNVELLEARRAPARHTEGLQSHVDQISSPASE